MLSQILTEQLFPDVDCSHLNYSTPVSEEVLAAAKKVRRITFDKWNALLPRLNKRGGVGLTRPTRRERFSDCQISTMRPSCTAGQGSARLMMRATFVVLFSPTN